MSARPIPDRAPSPAAPDQPSGDAVVALSFEDALGELERIVKALEGGQQKLEDAITAYERGAKLRAHCEAKLAEAEQRVQAIVAGAGGATGLRESE